jgi:hypothetical protein
MAAAAGRVRTECRNRFDDPVLCCKWCESKQSATWNAAVPVQFPKWPFSWPETPPMPASPHALATGLRDVQRLDFHAAVPLFLKPDETSPSPIITPCQFANRHSRVCFSIAFRAGHRHFSRETISKPTNDRPQTSHDATSTRASTCPDKQSTTGEIFSGTTSQPAAQSPAS